MSTAWAAPSGVGGSTRTRSATGSVAVKVWKKRVSGARQDGDEDEDERRGRGTGANAFSEVGDTQHAHRLVGRQRHGRRVRIEDLAVVDRHAIGRRIERRGARQRGERGGAVLLRRVAPLVTEDAPVFVDQSARVSRSSERNVALPWW